MTKLAWNKEFPVTKHSDIVVSVQVKDWPPKAAEELGNFIKGLIAGGCRISGDDVLYTEVSGRRLTLTAKEA